MSNRLAGTASPYLRQHASNPVHWQPWDAAALDLAVRLDKPILLSIGYSACHWCHVMARESFEDPDAAAVMNALFVCIKVDREERPDLDRLFLGALARLGRAAGWPLTAFLTPCGEPYSGGGYYPPRPAFGMPAFCDVLQEAAASYRRDCAGAAERGRSAIGEIVAPRRSGGGAVISTILLDRVAHELARSVDWLYGGFGIQAPKFLHAGGHEILLQAWARTGEAGLLDAVVGSVTQICNGGVYDHVGGGFHRYAADDRWRVPHFEKMLCDNALMLRLLVKMWQATGHTLFADRAAQTVGWLLREMRLTSGAFASSLGADHANGAELGEGAYYTWAPEVLGACVGDRFGAFMAAYELADDGPFGGRAVIARRSEAPSSRAAAEALERLRQHRAGTGSPARDEKVLADWNGLAVSALAEAGLAFARPDWITAASEAFAAVTNLLSGAESLRHCVFGGQAGPPGFLDDYANMAAAALSLYEATAEAALLRQAAAWVDVLNARFWDDAGGYFLTQSGAVPEAMRQTLIDETTAPAGNGTMLGVLPRLALLTGEDRHRQRAEAVAARFADRVSRASIAAATALNNGAALERLVQIVIVGDPGERVALLGEAAAAFVPHRLLIAATPAEAGAAGHPAYGKLALEGRPTAYVCVGPMCLPPALDAPALRALLAQGRLVN